MIKFRIWHKTWKRMFTNDHIISLEAYGDKGYGVVVRDPLVKDQVDFDPDEIVIMQFTGEYDLKKREIYDGDIILLDQSLISEPPNIHKCEVYWAQTDELHLAGWQLWCMPGIEKSHHGGVMRGFELGIYKILGNKYEHPKLLERGYNDVD